MVTFLRYALLLAVCIVPAHAACAVYNTTQFFNSNGAILTGGRIYTYAAGTTTPRATYSENTCTTPNANPIVLDASGRGQIWMDTTLFYKLLIQDSTGVTQQTIDGVSGGGGGGGGGSDSWTVSGSNIYRSSGNVYVGATSGTDKFEVTGASRFRGALRISNTDGTPRYVGLVAPTGMGGDYTLTLPASSGNGCLSNSSGTLSWLAGCSGSGPSTPPYSESFTGQTSVVLDHDLGTTNVIVACYAADETIIPFDVTNADMDITDANNVTVTFMGSTTGRCVVNGGGGDTFWSVDADDNVTLSDSGHTIDGLDFKDQTAGTGVTAPLRLYAGAGQMTADSLFVALNSAGVAENYIDGDGRFGPMRFAGASSPYVWHDGTSFVFGDNSVSWFGINTSTGALSFPGSLNGGGTECLQASATGVVTKTGSACGSGGASLPVTDTTSVVEGSADDTKQLRFEVDGFTTMSTRVLTPQNASYTIAGLETAQTFSADQTLSADLLAGANTRKLGNGTPFYQVQANRIEGSCSLCNSATNYINTRKVAIYDRDGISNAGWDIMTYVTGVGGTSYISFRDNVGTEALRLSTWETTNINQAKFALNVVPNGSFTIGVAGNPWPYGYFTDARVASLAGVGTRAACVDADGDFTVTDCSSLTNPMTTTGDLIYSSSGSTPARRAIGSANQILTVSGGVPTWVTPSFANTTLSNLGTTAINTSLLPSGGVNVGASGNYWTNGYVANMFVNAIRNSGNSGLGARCQETDNDGDEVVAAGPCVTTAGGQSISGTTTLSTLVVNTAATVNSLLTVNSGNIDIDTGQTYSVGASYFGQNLTTGFTVSLSGGGTCQIFIKSGIVYSTVYSGGGSCDGH